MSNQKPAGKPAQTPRPDEIWDTLYQAFISQLQPQETEYVCINPESVCDLNCCKCPYYVPKSDAVSVKPDLVTGRAGGASAGVTNPWADLPVNEPCVAPFGQLHYTYHTFQDWDFVDWQITNDYHWDNPNSAKPNIDIFGWRFKDSQYWHDELCPIPFGSQIVVNWGYANV